jgi:hypothetical protein
MKALIKTKVTVDKTALLRQIMAQLTDEDVYIGVPPEKDARPGSPVGNAFLSYVHEYGSARQNIPARPHLMPVIRSKRGFVIKRLEKAWEKTLQGDRGAVRKALEGIGAAVRNAVRSRFMRNNWRPLSKGGQKERMRKLHRRYAASGEEKQVILLARKARKALRAADKEKGARQAQLTNPFQAEALLKRYGFKFYPLVDTGTLRDAHDYVIKKRVGGGFGVLTSLEAEAGHAG